MAPTVSALLAHKGRSLVTIPPDATVFEAIGRMVESNVGSILVMDDEDVRGIFTERDYLRRIALEGRTSRETRVEEVMTRDLVTVTPDTAVSECLALMTERKIRHLPVLHAGHLVGVVSIGDAVRQLAEAAEGEAEELRRFVSGGYMG
ncbi:MAG TPA: CBS domain-containing protein [Bacteroidetes bacterium]|nr:CBS domain-containing protein [Bacteroidota bacterium]HIL58555.1 CBS domain-containing protein [Rhodothermales bacterium]